MGSKPCLATTCTHPSSVLPMWLSKHRNGWKADGIYQPTSFFPTSGSLLLRLVALCIFIIYMYLYHSAGGRRMRAVMQNREMASCLGISTRRVDAQSFAFGSAMAGIAGCALIASWTDWTHDWHLLHCRCLHGRCAWRNRQADRNRSWRIRYWGFQYRLGIYNKRYAR